MKTLSGLLLLLLFTDACVDRLDFDAGDAGESEIVVDGFISDQPGPYKIRIFLSGGIKENLLAQEPVNARQVVISDDSGETEQLNQTSPGIYETSPDGIRGQVGRKYKLLVELLNGERLESTPDELHPVGEVDNIFYRFESFLPQSGPTEHGFRVFMDAQSEAGPVRWRFTGTYIQEAFPALRQWPRGGCRGQPDPAPCSGFEDNGNSIKRVGECTCCVCYVNDVEDKPRLSNDVIMTEGVFRNVEMGFIPFDVWRFHFRKYMVKIEQMSLSEEAFQFWKIIKDQKEGINSLFQPAIGRVPTNFSSTNSSRRVAGFFYATAIKQKVVFINDIDAPIPVPEFTVPPIEVCQFWDVCEVVWRNSSRTPPPEWE